jgi:hypothetical protein
MRKLFYAGFCLVLAAGVGCAITDYELMFDSYSGEIINTNGKAKLIPSSQVALIWSDGADNLFSMVDQKANGDRTLTTYNFYTTDGTYFWDTTYCSPDWTGCSIWTAPDPEVGDVDPFDGSWNQNCSGSRSLYYLTTTTRYYGECGRGGLDVASKLQLLSTGQQVDDWTLRYNMNNGNTNILLNNNAGMQSSIGVMGAVQVEWNTRGLDHLILNMTHPLIGNTMRSVSDWNDRYGTGMTTATIVFNGVPMTFNVNILGATGDRL